MGLGRRKLGCACPSTSINQLVAPPSTPSCWQQLQAGTHEGVSKVAGQLCGLWGLGVTSICICFAAPPFRHPAATSCLAATSVIPIAVSLANSQSRLASTSWYTHALVHPALLPASRQTNAHVCTASHIASNLAVLVAGIQQPTIGGRAAVLLQIKGRCTTGIDTLQALVSGQTWQQMLDQISSHVFFC